MDRVIDSACDEFEQAWRNRRPVRIEDLLARSDSGRRDELLHQLICLEIELRQKAGETPQAGDYHIRFHEYKSLIDAAFAAVASLQPTKLPLVHDPYATTEMPATTSMSHNDTSDRHQAAAPRQIGRYTVLGELGRGGQADVFRAVHPTLPMEVAIKLTHATLEPGARDALREEAHILCDLDHPHIARVRDFDFVDGRPFMVLDFIRGRSLAQVADAEPLTPQAAARMVAKLARAIGFAHSRGVIHRDLKPENVVIGADGEPKIIDFGMSRLRTGMGGATAEANEVSGTLAYMASEQAQGITSKTDHRVDVFALGAILYRLLVGEPPYPRLPLPQLLQQVREGKWNTAKLDAAAIPTELRETCRRAMHFDPAQRYATAEALADALVPCTTDASKDTPTQSTPTTKRSPAVLVATLLVPLLAYGAYHFSRPPALPSAETKTSTGNSVDAGASVSAVPVGLIKRFDLIQIGNSDARAEFSGSLLEYRPPREHDDVQVFAEFSQPAYCFLVAMNPDGVKQLCYPSQSDQAQSDPIAELRFPAEENAAFGLTDGAGQQAFVLITSQTPLPSYQDWRSRLEPAPWPSPDVTGNWIYDSGELTAITKANVPQETRGTIRTTKTPTPFKELCDRLRDSEQSEVRGVLFEVEPQKP